MSRFLAFAAISELSGCAGREAPIGHTVAVHDGSAWVAVVWDGRVARVMREGAQLDAYPADTRIAALWGCRPEGLGTARAVRSWDRALADDELAALEGCAPGADTGCAPGP
jgi:hypothetical protein